jgi:polyhydroxyalkanoate synthesis regulator protein
MYGGQSQNMVPPFLESAMDAFKKNQETVAGAFSTTMFADLAKRNMALFGDAAQAFTPKSAAKASESDAAASEIAKLKAEVAALQAKVDKLG